MNFKYAVLAAAAVGLAGTAQAADLAKKTPAAANYVKVCDAYGAGFFYIPGSDTCLQIGGFVYAQFGVYGNKSNYGAMAPYGWGYGTGRNNNLIATGARINVHWDARTNTEFGLLRSYIELQETIGSQPYSNGPASGVVSVEKGFIQFGGLTVGRATSMFDFYTGSHLSSIYETAHSDANINLFAYTFSFGNGISATVSAEDPSTGSTGRYWAGPQSAEKMPDFVANVNIAQSWGSAQIMAALHQNYTSVAVGGIDADKMGFAVGGGVKIALPMLGASDELALQAAYAKGAVSYVSPDWYAAYDFTTAGGTLQQSKSWAIAAGFTHGWTKTISSSLTGSYAKFDGPIAGTDFHEWDVGGNVAWAPVAGFSVTTEVEYKKVDFTGAAADTHGLVGFVRVRRDF